MSIKVVLWRNSHSVLDCWTKVSWVQIPVWYEWMSLFFICIHIWR